MKRNKIFFFTFIVLFVIGVNSGCSKSGTSAYGGGGGISPAPNTVSIAGMAFAPSSLTVKVGTKVTWTNNDGYTHTVTSNDGTSFDSGNLASGASFSYTTTKTGTFDYHCNIHSGMAGTLIVTQ